MRTASVIVHAGDVAVAGDLVMPDDPRGVVLFAHGSGSSRHSPRNRAVASGLNEGGFGTLLMDLLTADEERYDAETAELRFDITLLTDRLSGAIDWLAGEPATSGLPLGLFGASTGAAAALAAAAVRPDQVAAVVSRGGRPDLAGPWLGRVRIPVLLIVGGRDVQVAQWNREAGRRLAGPIEIRVVAGASHLFEEPGALEQVTTLAAEWFRQHLRGAAAPVTLPRSGQAGRRPLRRADDQDHDQHHERHHERHQRDRRRPPQERPPGRQAFPYRVFPVGTPAVERFQRGAHRGILAQRFFYLQQSALLARCQSHGRPPKSARRTGQHYFAHQIRASHAATYIAFRGKI
jgi:putative phosphoribosyl transferase